MKFIRQITAVCMALVVLVSTTGFTMSMHFCGGELYNFAFFEQAEACEMHTKQPPPCHHQNTSGAEADCRPTEKKQTGQQSPGDASQPCCQDQSIVKEGQESLAETVTLKELKPDLSFIAVVASFLLAVIPASAQSFSDYHQYIPPLIERNIPVLVQSFLI